MFKVIYNDQDVFDGISPTPFVERNTSSVYGSRKQGEIESFILNGIITGGCPDGNEFSGLWQKGLTLIDRFSESFKSFAISEDIGSGQGILFSGDHAIIRSIDFPDNAYAGILPYSISLDIYKNESFLAYGILEPNQEIKFQMNDDGSVVINKKTSARGFNTDSGALDNAVNFVQGYTGWTQQMTPLFISSENIVDALLMSLEENVDRLSCSYEVNESWVYDPYGNYTQHGLYHIVSSVQSSDGGISVSLEGEFKGGFGTDWEDIRTEFSTINFASKAEDAYELGGGTGSLYGQPFRRSINEKTNDKSVSFNFEYRDTIQEDPYIIDNFNVSWDKESNKTCASAQISILSVDPCFANRWDKVKTYHDSFDVKAWINEKYDDYGYTGTLSNFVQSESVTYNERAASISLSATICDKKITLPSNFADLTYTVQIAPALPTYIPFQGLSCGSAVTVQKLKGNRRKTVSIQGEGVITDCSTKDAAITSLKSYINALKTQYLDLTKTFLQNSEIKSGGLNSRKISFSFSWNEEDTPIFAENKLNSAIT